jgi:hypothetical protein
MPSVRGARVPLAAGCAVCGADLDTARWDKGPGLGNRIGSTLTAFTFRGPGSGMKFLLIGFVIVFVATPVLAALHLI